MNVSNDDLLIRIANHLTLNASGLSDLGLYHGKAGVAIFLTHYSVYSGEKLYDEAATNILSEIAEEINADIPEHLEWGLVGIGWVVEHLVQNGFCYTDTNKALYDIDHKIMEKNLRQMSDISLTRGLTGIVQYYTKERVLIS